MRKKILALFYHKKKVNIFRILLVIVLLLGLSVRIIGIDPGFPQTHPDEPVLYATAVHLILNNTLDPFSAPTYKFQYPGFVVYLYMFLFKFLFIPVGTIWYVVQQHEFALKHLSNLELITKDFIIGRSYINALYWARYLTAVLSFVSVPLVYLIGKHMFHKYIGLVAAVFLAVNYRHTLSSHFSLIDGPNATFALLVLYTSLLVYKTPTIRNYLWLGVALALSIATKLYIFSILSFMFVHILVVFSKKGKERLYELFSKKVMVAGILSLIVFFLFNPFLPTHFEIAMNTHEYNNMRYGLFYPPFEITFPPIWYLFEIGYGKILSLLFLAGCVLLVKNKKYWATGIFLSIFILLPAIILLYFSHGAAYVRNFTSIIPFAILISAYALYTLFNRVWKFRSNKENLYIVTLVLLAIGISFDQVKNVVKLDYYATKPWSSTCIQEWMDSTLKSGNTVAINNLVPRSNNEGISYVTFDNTEYYKNGFTLATLQAEKIDYVVADVESLRGRFIWWVSASEWYWGMPVDIFDNSFDGLVLKELSRYIVKTCIKPWESPGNNYIAVKIPSESKHSELVLLQSHDFKSQLDKEWKLSNPFHHPVEEDVRVLHSDECLKMYCLRVEGRSEVPSREKLIITDGIKVMPGERYIVKAMVKSERKIYDGNRDGFLRIDYYHRDDPDYTKRGIVATVSQRYFGDGSWKELTASQVVPENAASMQVSFQVERYDKTFLIDDVRIYKTQEEPSREEIEASNINEIDNMVLYPLSLL